MSRKLPVLFIFSVAVLASLVALGPSRRSNSQAPSLSSAPLEANPGATHARIISSYGKLPLSFEKNQGQTDDRVRFFARGEGYALFLTGQEAVLRLGAPVFKDARTTAPRALRPTRASPSAKNGSSVVRLTLAGSNQHSAVEGLDLQPGRSNYLLGNDPAKWHTGVEQYARVKYSGVYPGVDLIYYGNQSRLESDYVLASGADPNQIALRVEGADSLQINSDGDLVLNTSAGEVLLRKPFAYQEVNGARQEVASNFFERDPHTVGIHVAPYDSARPLIVDPVLVYATYLGGTGSNDRGFGIAVDSTGNAYVTGLTTSTDFPTMGPLPTGLGLNGSTQAAFVTKLNPTASALVYSTYLGGTSGMSNGAGIAIDSAGDAFVTGGTSATDFPGTTSGKAIQPANLAVGSSTVFLAELAPNGASLVYSTYLGGSLGENPGGIALDSTGKVYLTGTTVSGNFPLSVATAPFQASNNAGGTGGGNVFLSRIDTTVSGTGGLLYSTYFGGSKGDSGLAIAVDSSANAFITGTTVSADFPQPTPHNGFQTTIPNSTGPVAFVARINTTVASTPGLLYSSFLGGITGGGTSPINEGNGIALGAGSHAVVVGRTSFPDFPTTTGALQTCTDSRASRIFISEFDTSGTASPTASLVNSTCFGGSQTGATDIANAVVTDSAGNIYLTGQTNSSDFPVSLGAAQTTFTPTIDAFMSQLNPAMSKILFSTYLAGPNATIGSAIALDPSGATPGVYIAGRTSSAGLPTTAGVFQKSFKLPEDAFIAKFSPAAVSGAFLSPPSKDFGTVNLNSPSSPQTFALDNKTSSTLTGIVISFTGANSSDFAQTSSGTCGATLAASSTCTIDVIFTPTTAGAASATLNVADSAGSQTAALSGTGAASSQPDFTLSVAPAAVSVVGGANGTFTVTVTSQGSFASAVALSCTGEPLNSTCAISPASVTPAAGGKQTATGTITTKALIPPSSRPFRRLPPVGVLGLLSLVLALFLSREAARRGARKLAWGFALLGVLALAGCSGLPATVNGGGGTPKGTTTLTITGTSASLSHTTTFTLTVN